MAVTVKQFGFSTGGGALANIVDESLVSYWQPLATNFAGYNDQFTLPDGSLNYGRSFPALEFDFGEARRVPFLTLHTETLLTLGPACIIGSDIGATSVTDVLQSGDIALGIFSSVQVNSNSPLTLQPMSAADIRKRFIRILQRSSDPAYAPPPPSNSATFDSGAGSYPTPDYPDVLTVEVWGGGASGGVSGEAANGAQSTAELGSVWSLEANGGAKTAQTAPNATATAGAGGTASGGNTTNATGEAAQSPSPLSTADGSTGRGGNSGDGTGGAPAVFHAAMPADPKGSGMSFGVDGIGPGGGGSGRNIFATLGAVYYKYPGGAGGGYVKHVLRRGIDGPEPGDLIDYVVGAGGVAKNGNGRGANGRVRFTWS